MGKRRIVGHMTGIVMDIKENEKPIVHIAYIVYLFISRRWRFSTSCLWYCGRRSISFAVWTVLVGSAAICPALWSSTSTR